ncbi:MAG: cytochrome c-type biogenesis protein CcmH [Planctomycetota bacterium]
MPTRTCLTDSTALRRWGLVFVAWCLAISVAVAQPMADPQAGGSDADGTGSMVERRVGSEPAVHGHDASKLRGLADEGFNDAQMKRIHRLEVEVMCACPKENWSRTLSNCPDACADPQKSMIRSLVREGLDDEQVKDRMLERFGARVLSTPDHAGFFGKLAYWLPLISLAVVLAVATVILVIWTSSHRRSAATAELEESGSEFSNEELDRVSAELEELD